MKYWRIIAVIPLFLLLGCGSGDPYKLPPPRNTQLLPTAQGTGYDPPPAQSSGTSPYCVTTGGYCPMPGQAATGLACTCDSSNPKFSYGGKVGPIPAMPDWADPRR